MALFPEREKLQVPENIKVTPEAPPPEIEKAGVSIRPTQPFINVSGDQNLASPVANSGAPSIQIPADQATLAGWSKGSISNSLTWLGVYWLRMIKRAVHFGWRIANKN